MLCAEDEDAVRRLMHKFLERGGYEILEVRNGEEAITLANACKEPIQVLVTDVAMSGISGPDLAKRLVSVHPGMKICSSPDTVTTRWSTKVCGRTG